MTWNQTISAILGEAWHKRTMMLIEAKKIEIKCNKLAAKQARFDRNTYDVPIQELVENAQTWKVKSMKTYAECRKLKAESDKMNADAEVLWLEAVLHIMDVTGLEYTEDKNGYCMVGRRKFI